MEPGGNAIPAFLADEIGLAYLRRGDLVVKTAFEPVFTIYEGDVVPVALRAFHRSFQDGREVAEFVQGGSKADEQAFEMACNLAHIRNFDQHRGEDVALLFLRLPSSDQHLIPAFLDAFDDEIMSGETDPARIVCEILPDRGIEVVKQTAEQLRGRGVRLCLGGLREADVSAGPIEMLRPDIVRFDPHWLRRAAAVEQARALLGPLVRGIQANGALVMADELRDEAGLDLAREIGVDLLAGSVLAPAFVAGTAREHRASTVGKAAKRQVATRPFRRQA
jgi:EAL domain-containing protein (putative c-di-GMP-specific phosphodiesterase class I)